MGNTSISFPTVAARITKVAEVLKVSQSEVESVLNSEFGIEPNEDSLMLLDAQTTTELFIRETLSKSDKVKWPVLKIMAVAAILKGSDPFAKAETEATNTKDGGVKQAPAETQNPSFIPPQQVQIIDTLAELTRSLKDPKQMKDKDLLELYDKERDYEVEQELHRRANFQHFVVLKNSSAKDGKKEIDIEMSLELLKRSRRMVNPTLVRQEDIFVNVYRITELNPEDQIVEICPFCGEITYKGYCEKCNSDLNSLGDDEKAYIKLITETESFDKNSNSDRRDVLRSAGKGLEDLRKTWPRVSKRFDELKLLNDLPKLRKSRTLPSQRPADPFHVR